MHLILEGINGIMRLIIDALRTGADVLHAGIATRHVADEREDELAPAPRDAGRPEDAHVMVDLH